MGCARGQYRPHVRPDHASLFIEHFVVKLVVNAPTILAISLAPPFACDAETIRLAREGPLTLEDEPVEVTTFASFRDVRSVGAYRVATYHGEAELKRGPNLIVISGDESSHPAVSALNIANRYNDVAVCLQGQP